MAVLDLKCVKLVNNNYTIESLREKIINSKTNIYKHLEWLNEYHYDLKDEAIRCYINIKYSKRLYHTKQEKNLSQFLY